MPVKVYQYPKCSTCRRALKWLDARGIRYEPIDIVATPPSRSELARALERLPLKKLFNTSGQSYREGGWSSELGRSTVAQALDALAADGKLVKRPFLLNGDDVLVGFDERAYEEALLGPSRSAAR